MDNKLSFFVEMIYKQKYFKEHLQSNKICEGK